MRVCESRAWRVLEVAGFYLLWSIDSSHAYVFGSTHARIFLHSFSSRLCFCARASFARVVRLRFFSWSVRVRLSVLWTSANFLYPMRLRLWLFVHVSCGCCVLKYQDCELVRKELRNRWWRRNSAWWRVRDDACGKRYEVSDLVSSERWSSETWWGPVGSDPIQ